jgi:hypothetical protein
LQKRVLLQFNVKRLLWNQLIVSVITELILFFNSSGLVFDILMLVSAANNIGLAHLLMVNERSLREWETVMDPIPNPVEHHVSYVPI